MTRSEVLKAVALVSMAWSNWHLPEAEDEAEAVIKAWLRVLAPFDNSLVVAAIDSYIVEAGQFAPHQGMVAKRAAELQARATGDEVPGLDEAWAEVQREIARVGWTGALDPQRKPLFTHPTISAAVEAMGWQTLCESTNPEADRAHFFKLYGSATQRATRDAVMPASVRELLEAGVKQLAP